MKGSNLRKGIVMFTFLIVLFLIITLTIVAAMFIGIFGGFGLFVVADIIVAIWIVYHLIHKDND
jgi:hypothetical protein